MLLHFPALHSPTQSTAADMPDPAPHFPPAHFEVHFDPLPVEDDHSPFVHFVHCPSEVRCGPSYALCVENCHFPALHFVHCAASLRPVLGPYLLVGHGTFFDLCRVVLVPSWLQGVPPQFPYRKPRSLSHQ